MRPHQTSASDSLNACRRSFRFFYGVWLRGQSSHDITPLKVNVPLHIFTDSKSIFATITTSKRLREIQFLNNIVNI